MILTLNFREQLTKLGAFLEQELSQLVASIQGSWDVEHLLDGTHGNVTAESLSTRGGLYEHSRDTPAGEWKSPVYASTNFTGNGSMSWDVSQNDISSFSYMAIGKTLFFRFIAIQTTVGGTVSSELRLRVPGGYLPAVGGYGTFGYVDNGGAEAVGIWSIVPKTNYIVFHRAAGAAWTASANNTSILAQGFFEVIQN